MADESTLEAVKAVYNGPEGDLWELIMGQQIHVGGLRSSMDLAMRAAVEGKAHGVDLCCCNGAGMRFLARFQRVARLTGVDATGTVIERGIARCRQEGFGDRITFVKSDVCRTGLADGCADFVWGEDAWCYVEDKAALIAEAVRLVAPGGTIAFTDWVAGEVACTDAERARFLSFMKFPNVQSVAGYRELLERNGCKVIEAVDTGRFPEYVELYIAMVDRQLTYDALRILNFDEGLLAAVAGEMSFMLQLARDRKITQGLLVARKGA